MLELYHWEPNGSHLKPLIVLHEKGLEFRSHYVDLLSEERSAAGLPAASRETRLNLEGEGPLLVHDGLQISESLFLLEYLEDAFPNAPMRPSDALGQARILAWARFINEVYMPAASTLGCHTYTAPLLQGRRAAMESAVATLPMSYLRDNWKLAMSDGYSAELLEDSRRKLTLTSQRIEEALSEASWLVGSQYSLADIDAFSISHSLTNLAPTIVNDEKTPRMMAWLRRIRDRPAVRAALSLSRTGNPESAFAPGPEHSRWG